MIQTVLSETTHVDALVALARTRPLRAADVEAAGIPRRYLSRLTERGLLQRVARGVYRAVDADVTEHASLAEVAVAVPRATICLLSALEVHGLTSERPYSVWIMMHRRAARPRLEHPPIEVVWATGDALTWGLEHRTLDGVPVPVTSPAKTVADCFRYERHVGREVAIAALREYLGGAHRDVDALMEAAQADRVTRRIRPYVEALA